MASLAVGDEEAEVEEKVRVRAKARLKSGEEKLLRLNELTDDLLKSRLISSSSHRFQTHHHDRAKEQPACVYEELGI